MWWKREAITGNQTAAGVQNSHSESAEGVTDELHVGGVGYAGKEKDWRFKEEISYSVTE